MKKCFNRILIMLMCVLMAFSGLVACSNKTNDNPNPTPNPNPNPNPTPNPNPSQTTEYKVKFTKEYMSGKTVVIYGDSLSARAELETIEYDYIDYLSEKLEFTYIRKAVRGSALTYKLANDNPNIKSGLQIISENEVSTKSADVIIMFYGANDFNYDAPIGYEDDEFDTIEEVTSFKGAMVKSIELIKKQNANAEIVWLGPIYNHINYDGYPFNFNGTSKIEYINAIKDTCDYLDIRYIELYDKLGFDKETFYAGSEYSMDGAHLTEKAHSVLAKYLIENDGGKWEDEVVDMSKYLDVKLTKEYMQGKKVVSYGDSISSYSQVEVIDGKQTDYVDILSQNLGFTFTRLGVPGSRLSYVVPSTATKRKSGAEIVVDNQDANSVADVAIIAYGTNDFGVSVPMGRNSDKPIKKEQVSTFKGAINFMVKTLRKHNPDIRIIFLTPIYRNDKVQNGIGLQLNDYAKAIMDLAEVNGYRYIDMFNSGIFNESNFYSGSNYTPDGLHPNTLGHQVYAEYLLNYDK